MIMDIVYKLRKIRIETIYIPPDRRRRLNFLENWSPAINGEDYILTGDFNVNLLPQNRISLTNIRHDPSIPIIQLKINNLIDTQILSNDPSLQTFAQKTK